MNCAFYNKIGACRHGDRCQRLHNKPLFSLTVCLKGLYVNPINKIYGDSQREVRRLTMEEEREIQAGFEEFYLDVFEEVSKYGEVEDLHVCDNLADHLIGEWVGGDARDGGSVRGSIGTRVVVAAARPRLTLLPPTLPAARARQRVRQVPAGGGGG